MFMTRWLICAILAAALSLVPVLSDAQTTNQLELNFFGGGSIFTKKSYEIGFPQSSTPIPGEIKLDRTLRGGVRVGITRGRWSEEFFYSYEPTTARFVQPSVPGVGLDLDIQVHNYGINALYYLK